MKLQILGGTARGVRLEVPTSARPSPVRLRKALFDYLRSRYPRKGRFLDLYAGSGAIGLEAASEGFEVVLVEKDPQAVRILRANALKAHLEVRIEPQSVERYLALAARRGEQFTVAFMAPPYPHNLLEDFQRLLEAGLAAPGGIYILQHPTELYLPQGERRVYGANAITVVERQ